MNLRVLYLFAGPRRKLYEQYKKGEAPDTYLVGLNRMTQYGIQADFLENQWTEFFRRFSFNLTQLPAVFKFRRYDVIFSGSGIFTLFVCKFILRFKKPKWVIYNTYLSNLLKRNNSGIKGWVIKKAVLSVDAVVSPSKAQKEFLKNFGLPDYKNHYIPYGVDFDFYQNKNLTPVVIDGRYIFSAGRDVGRDYLTLISAIRQLSVKLLIAALPRNVKEIEDLPNNVQIGYFKPSEMPSLFKNSSFVVVPTIPENKMVGSDCSGQYVLLEAMASGKAVITSDRATLLDYFTDNQHGLVVEPENVEQLNRAINTLWYNPEQANKMGQAGQENVKRQFTMDIFSKKLAEVFKIVVNN